MLEEMDKLESDDPYVISNMYVRILRDDTENLKHELSAS